MKIAILGSTGMLGSTVGKHFIEKFGEKNVWLSHRMCGDSDHMYGKNKQKFYYDAYFDATHGACSIPIFDWVINCIGCIKPHMKNLPDAILINSVFPHVLADRCKDEGTKLIHITTDCVYSGKSGNYDENSPHDALDEYGKTKSLGEPKNCLVLRTSIIGEETVGRADSLVEWLKSQKGKTVSGYTNHIWNGITTLQYSKICEQIINEDLYKEDLFHIHSPSAVNKAELLLFLEHRFNLEVTINLTRASCRIDRSLSTSKDLNAKLQIPSITNQIEEM